MHKNVFGLPGSDVVCIAVSQLITSEVWCGSCFLVSCLVIEVYDPCCHTTRPVEKEEQCCTNTSGGGWTISEQLALIQEV